MKLAIYIMAPERISAAYFANTFRQSASIYASLTVIRQRLCENVTAARNMHAAPCSMQSVSYEGKYAMSFPRTCCLNIYCLFKHTDTSSA
jgi:hypothetical protein